jgi:hypothetical protein
MCRWLWILCLLFFALPAGAVTLKRGPGSGGGFGNNGVTPNGSGNFLHRYVTTPSEDDVPGVADGAGADPVPFTGNQAATITLDQVFGFNSVSMVDWIHCTSGYNEGCGGVTPNPNLPSIGFSTEYSYDAGAADSGPALNEYYWSIDPASSVVSFSAGAGNFPAGENITFSGGEVCRSLVGTVAMFGTPIRMVCVGGDYPDIADTITVCAGGCTGTVSGSVADSLYRPFFFFWNRATNRTSFEWNNIAGNPWMSMQPGISTMFAGWGGPGTGLFSLNIPSGTSGHFFNGGGSIGVDESVAATTGGQFVFDDGTTDNVLSPTNMMCMQFHDLDATDDNAVLSFSTYQPITVTALGCRNELSAAAATAATITLETLAGAAITLTTDPLTCVGNATAITWDTTVDADAVLASGMGVRIDTTNTPNPATDEHTICIAFRYTRQ